MGEKYCYDYPRAAVTTDCVVFGFDGENLKILLIKRGLEPFKGRWALPGGFMNMNETTNQCAERELKEETGVSGVFMKQIQSFSTVDRDPRGRVVTVAYYALINPQLFNKIVIAVGDDAADAKWFPLEKVLNESFPAFDHLEIIRTATAKLRQEIKHYPIAFELLDARFTIKQLQSVYELILDKKFDRANFHKKMVGMKPKKELRKNMGILIDTGEVVSGAKHKPAKIYMFDRLRFEKLMEKGDFTFDF